MDSDIQILLDNIKTAIDYTVPQNSKNKAIGVAFSGGVDSSLIAKLCVDMDYDVTLLTIGFAQSHDINFAKTVNRLYRFKHEILEIDNDSFQKVFPRIRKKIDTDNLSWNENCIAFYYVSSLAKRLDISSVVTANGVDELFCGYNAYRDVFDEGLQQILTLMNTKLDNELHMMKAVNLVASEFGVTVHQPLLSADFIKYAKTVPLSDKIIGKDDLMRKHIIRRLASQCGVPKISCEKRKKALQYGSKIHKTLIKSR